MGNMRQYTGFFQKNIRANIKEAVSLYLIFVLAGVLLGNTLPLLLISVIFLMHLCRSLRGVFAISYVARFTVALFILTALVQLVGLLVWTFHGQMPVGFYSILTSLVALFAVILSENSNKHTKIVAFAKPGFIDVLIITPVLVVMGILVARVALPEPNSITTSMLRTSSFGMDDATHFSLLNDVLRSSGNLINGDRFNSMMSIPSHGGYPMGWHQFAAVIITSVIGNSENLNGINIFIWYYLIKLFSVTLIALSISVLLAQITLRERKELMSSWNVILQVFCVSLVMFTIALPIFTEGFLSFMPVLASIGLLAALMLSMKGHLRPAESYVTLALIVVAATAWILLAPAMLAAFMITALRYVKKIRELNKHAVLAIFVGIAVITAQALILLSFSGKDAVDSVTATGGILAPEHILAPLTLLAAIVLINRESGLRNIRPLLMMIALTLASILAIVLLKSDSITYYYYKVQFSLLFLTVPLAFILLTKVVKSHQDGKSNQQSVYVLALAPSICLLMIPSIVGFNYTKELINRVAHRPISKQAAHDILSHPLSYSNSDSRVRTLYYFPNDTRLGVTSSNFARTMYRSTTCDQDMFYLVYQNDKNGLIKTIEKCYQTLPLIDIVTEKSNINSLKLELQPLIDAREVTVREVSQ